MALISENVRKNALKCKECAFKKIRVNMDSKIDKNSVLYDEAKMAVDSFMALSCNLCPNKADFEKVYGMSPGDYFSGTVKKKK